RRAEDLEPRVKAIIAEEKARVRKLPAYDSDLQRDFKERVQRQVDHAGLGYAYAIGPSHRNDWGNVATSEATIMSDVEKIRALAGGLDQIYDVDFTGEIVRHCQ